MKRIAKFVFHLAFIFAISRNCDADNLKIHGVVMDRLTRAFVVGARVSVSGQRATHDAVTDSEGFFLLPLREGIKPGDMVRIRVDKDGYEAYDREEPASPEKTLEILLQPTARSATPRKLIPKSSAPAAGHEFKQFPADSNFSSHPIISAATTNVIWRKEERRLTVMVRLHNSGTVETMARTSFAFFWNGTQLKPDVPDRNAAFAPQDKIEFSSDMTFSQQDAVSFIGGAGILSVRVTAQYMDRGQPTVYVLEGRADSQTDHLDITQSSWSHYHNL